MSQSPETSSASPRKPRVRCWFVLGFLLVAGFAAYTCIVPRWWQAYDGPYRRDGIGPGFAIPASWWRLDVGLVDTDGPMLERTIREHANEPRVILEGFASHAAHLDPKILGIRPDDVVLDVGAGNGGLEVRLLVDKVPFRKLYAADIDPRAVNLLQFILDTVPFQNRDRVVPTLVQSDRISLSSKSIDLAVVISTPVACSDNDRDFVEDLRRIMKPNARFHYLVEQGREQAGSKRCRLQDVTANLTAAGFRLESKTVIEVVHVARPAFPWTLLPPPPAYLDDLQFRAVDR